ncbi:hypothetical protein GC173_12910 [bacterium]|nr:hypothetical protein [bacterium]
MNLLRFVSVGVVSVMFGLASGEPGADAPTSSTLVVSQGAAASRQQAIEFLTRLEKKNEGTKTLSAEFDQVRIDFTFDDEVKSSGRFWYRAPSSYYAEYESEHSSKVWSDEKRLVEYIPSLNQVDVVPMEAGEEAPVTQVLLGFGIKVDRILRLFDVQMADSEEKGLVSVDFLSKDLDKTLNFSRIKVAFDEKGLEPRVILMEDNTGTRTIRLKKVKFNPVVKDSIFEIPKFSPDKVDINGAEYL